jgi:hypothetical protein
LPQGRVSAFELSLPTALPFHYKRHHIVSSEALVLPVKAVEVPPPVSAVAAEDRYRMVALQRLGAFELLSRYWLCSHEAPDPEAVALAKPGTLCRKPSFLVYTKHLS